MMIKYWSFTWLCFLFIQCGQQKDISLSGTWYYKLDENNTGIAEKWYIQKFDNTLILPGSLRDNGIGENPGLKTNWTGSIYDSSWYFNPKMKKYRDIEKPKFPFWLTPEKHYVGAAWYQKEIEIPNNWKNKTVILRLERPHWQTKVWVDTISIGTQNSLSTPHIFEIKPALLQPGKHLLTIRVDNAIRDIDPGINSHSITDHTQGNWNGMVGQISLETRDKAYLGLIRLNPELRTGKVKTKIFIHHPENLQDATLTILARGINHQHLVPSQKFSLDGVKDELDVTFSLGEDFKKWSEFRPNLYRMTVKLEKNGKEIDKQTTVFGMREFTIDEKRFKINGIPVFLRGTTDCCVFPLTGYPPTDEKEWTRIFNICKSFGLNHIRFHSYCPPEAAFSAADKAGIYLQVEGPSWAKYSTTLGDGKPIDQYLMEETKRIIDTYGNHPSFCMMAYGNEPSGNYVPYLENWVDHFREYDPQRVFTGASTGGSWAIIENSDYLVRARPRGLAWKDRQPESIFDYRDKTENQQKPYVSFEMGQWCVFPNFKEIDKYTGPLKARNFELFREDLSDKHMGDQANEFLMASGKLQASCYKQEIEATLRTPNLAGFQLLSLNDFSGQGTALVGVLDAFWDEKGYISSSEFKSFCNNVVPLVRLAKFTYFNNESLEANIEVANFESAELKDITTRWSLFTENNNVIDSGSVHHNKVPIGNCIPLGKIESELSSVKKAEKLTLKVTFGEYSNQWNVWVYPVKQDIDTTDIFICKALDKEALQVLEEEGKVLLLTSGEVENGKDVMQYLIPVFWNTSWFRMRPPHTTGILIQDNHPVFNYFPTDDYSDLQWWEIANRQQVMNLENFPERFRPIVQPIDTWFLNRRLAMLFEAKVNKGKIMVCSINLSNTENKPVAGQLKKSILKYMQSELFDPRDTIQLETIHELFEKKERESWNSYVKAKP